MTSHTSVLRKTRTPRRRHSFGARRHHAGRGLGEKPKDFIAVADGREVLKFVPLGGCGEVTRSCYVYEYQDDIVIIDMGMQFPEEDMPGIDYLIPNVEYLKHKKNNIRGVIITHGHYDHIGAIPHLLEPLGYPTIYATALTRGMILKRQEDFRYLATPRIETITPDSKLKLGNFEVEFFHVNHNIPDSVGVVLKTAVGTVVHTGDWKFDLAPVNEKPADMERLSAIGKSGVALLVSDSTDSEEEGHQFSEQEIQRSLEEIFKQAKGRIIAATFASLLTRIQQLIWLSEQYGRKVLIEGYSMKQNVAVAQELGYLKVKKGTFISSEEFERLPDDKITILCTGAQGEDRAVLMRIASGEHRAISIKPNDAIIFSSSVIPGNEATVQRLKDVLYKKADKIYHYTSMDIHAGGHAKRDELREMVELTCPKYFIPIHGNYFMLKLHAELAESAGMPKENVMVAEDGDIVEITRERIQKSSERANVTHIMVDGLGVGDVGEVVLRDRSILAKDGMFVIIATIDPISGKVRGNPDIISRGFVYLRESKALLDETRRRAKRIVEEATRETHPVNWAYVRDELREKIGSFLFQKTKRRPMVLPVVIEV